MKTRATNWRSLQQQREATSSLSLRCEIENCFELVLGCREDDGCPAQHLCLAHYFAVALLRGTASGSPVWEDGFRRVLARDREKLLAWREAWSLEHGDQFRRMPKSLVGFN